MKFNTEMKVVRFGSEDVIATSGFIAAGFGDSVGGNASFTYNGTRYIIGTDISSQDFLLQVGAAKNAGVDNGNSTMSFNNLFKNENTGTGVGSKRWNGTYSYDANATWTNNNNQTFYGVFIKQ